MSMRFILDEHLRGGLWKAIQRHNLKESIPIEVTRVGDPPDLSLGAADPKILQWAERENHILVSADRETMFVHFERHLEGGHHSPGVFILSQNARIYTVVSFLALVTEDNTPRDWEDRIEWVK